MTPANKLTKVMPLLLPLFGKARDLLSGNRSADQVACRAAVGVVVWMLNAFANAQSLEARAIDRSHAFVPKGCRVGLPTACCTADVGRPRVQPRVRSGVQIDAIAAMIERLAPPIGRR
jgi:hypothetical protein